MAGQTSVGRLSDTPFAAGQRTLDQKIYSANIGGGACKDVRVNVDTVTNGATYTLLVAAVTLAYTASGAATAAEIRDGLIDLINENEALGNRVYAESVDGDTLKIVAREINDDFSFSESDAKLSSSVQTAAADFESVDFGVLVMHGSDAGTIQKPTALAAVAQVIDLAPTPTNNARYMVAIKGDFDGSGWEEVYTFEYLADASATAAEIVNAFVADINGQMPASSILAANSADKLRLTAEVAGTPFEARGASDDAASPWTLTEVTANVTADFTRRIAGGVIRRNFARQDDAGDAAYGSGEEVPVCYHGPFAVLLDAGVNPALGDPVYVRCTAGAAEVAGACRTDSDGGDAVRLSRAAWRPGGARSALGGVNVAWIDLSPV